MGETETFLSDADLAERYRISRASVWRCGRAATAFHPPSGCRRAARAGAPPRWRRGKPNARLRDAARDGAASRKGERRGPRQGTRRSIQTAWQDVCDEAILSSERRFGKAGRRAQPHPCPQRALAWALRRRPVPRLPARAEAGPERPHARGWLRRAAPRPLQEGLRVPRRGGGDGPHGRRLHAPRPGRGGAAPGGRARRGRAQGGAGRAVLGGG